MTLALGRVLISSLLGFSVWFLWRIVRWRIRIARVGKTMPVIPVLIHPFSTVRRLIPEGWQQYHYNWQFRRRREYDSLGTNMIPLISLFGLDSVYISDPDVVAEISASQNATRFPKDVKLYGKHPCRVWDRD